jgi:hypothetical protein
MKKTRKRHVKRTPRRPPSAQLQLRENDRVTNSVSLVCPSVIELGDPSLREAFRLWWHPYDMGADFDALTGQHSSVPFRRGRVHGFKRVPAKHPVLPGDLIERRKLDPGYYQRIERAMRVARVVNRKTGKKVKLFGKPRHPLPNAKPAPVKVLITLSYPLTERRSKLVTIDRRYPGEIFALTHDFYRELYAEDEREGGTAGPMNGGKGPLLNRGRGPLVWGHDLGDLVFERCEYRALPKSTVRVDVRGQVIARGNTKPPGRSNVAVEGEFTFGIGS